MTYSRDLGGYVASGGIFFQVRENALNGVWQVYKMEESLIEGKPNTLALASNDHPDKASAEERASQIAEEWKANHPD